MATSTKTKDPIQTELKLLARQQASIKATLSRLNELGHVRIRGRGSNSVTLQNSILSVLAATGEVMKTSAIGVAVRKAGYKTEATGKNFGIQISNALAGLKVDRCVSNRDRGYWSITKTGSTRVAA